MKFDQLTKKNLKNFDQTPKLTENFDQLKMSSEIRSSDHSPFRTGLKRAETSERMAHRARNCEFDIIFLGIFFLCFYA